MKPGGNHAGRSSRAWAALAGYAIVTFAWTWTFWWGGVIAGALSIDVPVGLVVFLGGPGPLLGALFVLRRSAPSYRSGFLGRIVDPRRVPGAWWLATAAVAVLPALVGYLGSAAAGRAPAADLALSAGVIVFAVGFALAAGLVEEPGWRGVGHDVLQSRVKPAVGAVVVGALWMLWHLPLFFLEGTYQHALGVLTARFWAFNLALVLLSVLYAWLCNGSRGSILIAVIAHAGTNIAGSVIPQDALTDLIRTAALVVAAAAVIGLTRGDLAYGPQRGTRATHAPAARGGAPGDRVGVAWAPAERPKASGP
jgi:membrane protease YdiL (CAAX protease family)